jgi:hypothetical protein
MPGDLVLCVPMAIMESCDNSLDKIPTSIHNMSYFDHQYVLFDEQIFIFE